MKKKERIAILEKELKKLKEKQFETDQLMANNQYMVLESLSKLENKRMTILEFKGMMTEYLTAAVNSVNIGASQSQNIVAEKHQQHIKQYDKVMEKVQKEYKSVMSFAKWLENKYMEYLEEQAFMNLSPKEKRMFYHSQLLGVASNTFSLKEKP